MQGILGKTKKKNEDMYSSDAYNAAMGYAEKMKPSSNGPQMVQTIGAPSVAGGGNKRYDANTDYKAKMNDAIARGDYSAAKEYERLRNEKIGDLGLGYETTGIFNYIDKKGLGGFKEGKRQEIEDYYNKGFQYNHEEDPEYQAMRRLKEKEADKAYKDGYAQMSTAFDGDIPVNMINKLLKTKSEVVDQADSYIPQLRAMAYDMYMDKGNALYNQYNMLANEEAQDYNRWASDRDMFVESSENAYNRKWNEEERDDYRKWRQKQWDRDEAWRAEDQAWREKVWNKEQDWKQSYFDQDSIMYWSDYNYRKGYDDWYKKFLEDQFNADEKYRYAALYR